ncbi:MAG: hypothetical protein HFG26_01565 [Provencibacterium sp.]|nr:hypothetical protein [Provencibacterium sp.]
MFGYIQPFKPMLRICEYDTYKAVYCGLCKQLSRSYGPFARLTLSYDFTFLALLQMAVSPDPPHFQRENCLYNPLKKRPCCQNCSSLQYSASAAMLLLYYKLLDNLADERYPKKWLYLFALPFVRRAWKKARAQLPQIESEIERQMKKQALLEQNKCSSVDEASEPIAASLSALFRSVSQDSGQRRVLERLGYLMGRWIYLADALDDLEEDQKKGRYNPFILEIQAGQAAGSLKEQAVLSLNMTVGEIIKTFELLTLHRYQDILSNVIHLGLKASVNRILAGDGKKSK